MVLKVRTISLSFICLLNRVRHEVRVTLAATSGKVKTTNKEVSTKGLTVAEHNDCNNHRKRPVEPPDEDGERGDDIDESRKNIEQQQFEYTIDS